MDIVLIPKYKNLPDKKQLKAHLELSLKNVKVTLL